MHGFRVRGRIAGRKDAPGFPTVMDPRGVAFVRGSIVECCAVDNAAQTSAPGRAVGSYSAQLDSKGGILPFHASSPGLGALQAGWVPDCLVATRPDYPESAGTLSHHVLDAHSVLPIPDDIASSQFALQDLRCG